MPARCKAAKAAYMRKWQVQNRERVNAYARELWAKKADDFNEKRRLSYQKNRRQVLERNAIWAAKNKDKIRARHLATSERRKARRRANQAKETARLRVWREKNREKSRSYMRNYEARRSAVDIQFRLIRSCRRRLALSLKGNVKASSTYALIGCTPLQLKAHLEGQFRPGMSWDNWGRWGWHIDHKRPISSFDLADPEQQAAACHFSNLQPLWWQENLSKGATHA